MVKALIFGIDAVEPKYIFENPTLYPNISKLIETGASSAYSAYAQKGYTYSYLSEMSWSSIYTGLSPAEHRVLAAEQGRQGRAPTMADLDKFDPFWKVCNQNGLTVGLWSALCCTDPVEIDGYSVAVEYEPVETPVEVRTAPRQVQVCEKDRYIFDCLPGMPPPRLYPQTLAQQGVSFGAMKADDDLAWETIEKYHFQDGLENLRQELDYYCEAIIRAQEKNPVDVLFFYTPTTDIIAHSCMYCDDNDTLIRAYQMVDQFVGKLMDRLEPDNTIFLSDHGMMNFKDQIICSDPVVRREAFSARDEVLWLKNGYIAFEAHNGALLFTAHAPKGIFAAAGKDIRHVCLKEVQTLDFYPTLLELLGIRIEWDRMGYVLDLFNRPVVNQSKLLKEDEVLYRRVALIQCHNPGITDIVLNELYTEQRFAKITVVGEEKYREIYLHNPRVAAYITHDMFDASDFDAVYCGICSGDRPVRHVLVSGKRAN